MFQSKIASLALAGLMTIGGVETNSFSAQLTTPTPPEKPSISINFNKEVKQAEITEKKEKIEGIALEFAEKSQSFEKAKSNMLAKLLESGKTQDQIDALIEQFTSKFDELKSEKGAETFDKKVGMEAYTADRTKSNVKAIKK